MSVPADSRDDWAALDGAAKRARVLRVAGELFARDGLDVPMPVLAEAIGVGVGSIYRQIGRKEDIVAALIAERIAVVAGIFERAVDEPDPWAALHGATFAVVAAAVDDRVTHESWAASSEHPDVLAARPRAAAALDALVDRVRAAGVLREDATADDLRLAFRAMKDVDDLGPGGARRLAELVLRGMRAPVHSR
ncbi:TetR/AcrR family transcriptional regulator [Patulibacter minatonensis]|uniref:TetR/AcrR family transcriptional regulator n=1 Tax=Patulibacter minatonensis TaxID=298163 RepID=UPI000479DB45|nr:TetR/AcrR family transcriptional regulator [Patulibacter minatonensis]